MEPTQHRSKIPFLHILEEHEISIDLLAHFTHVSPWTVFKVASHRPVDRATVQRILADVSILARQPFSLENVEVATYDPETEPEAGYEDPIRLSPHPSFRRLLEFHAIQPAVLSQMTGVSLDRIHLLANCGVGEADVIESLLRAIAKLTGFLYLQHMTTCTVLSSQEVAMYQRDHSPPEDGKP
jgi:hypothetical protein